MGPVEASEDALQTGRSVRQYGLLALDGPGARWGAQGEGYRGDGPSGGRRFELGSLFAADTRFYGLTTSRGTVPRALQSGQTMFRSAEREIRKVGTAPAPAMPAAER